MSQSNGTSGGWGRSEAKPPAFGFQFLYTRLDTLGHALKQNAFVIQDIVGVVCLADNVHLGHCMSCFLYITRQRVVRTQQSLRRPSAADVAVVCHASFAGFASYHLTISGM